MLGALRSGLKRRVLRAMWRRAQRAAAAKGVNPDGLDPGHWDLARDGAGRLTVQGLGCRELAQDFGTPLHVVNHARLAANYRAFVGAFRAHYPRVELGYSYKTNPLPGVLSALHELGASAEVISHFELWLALRLGVPGERIVFNGPGKTAEALELAVRRGVKVINIDGPGEIAPLAAAAARHGRRQDVGVRVVTSVGWSSQFGLPIADGAAMAAFRRLAQVPQLRPCGLHVHLGTGIRRVDVYLQAVEEVLAFAVRLKEELGIALDYLDLGGGFGVPTVKEYSLLDLRLRASDMPVTPLDPESCPPLEAYAGPIAQRVKGLYVERTGIAPPLLIFEPGRAVTSSAQFLLLQVLARKEGEGGRQRLILNGGKNLAMPTGYEYHELLAVDGAERPVREYDVYGPLCHPGDLLYRRKRLPETAPGDWLAVMDAGAYFIPNQMNFSHPRPGAVMVRDGAVRLIRRHECFEDVVARDVLPAVEGAAQEGGGRGR